MAFTDILRDAAPFIPSLVGLLAANQQRKPTQAEQAQADQLRREQYLQEQVADPNSTLMQKYRAEDEATNKQDFATAVASMMRANQRNVRLGRNPLFDPETADQSIWRATQQGYGDIQQNSRANAQKTILGLAGGAGNLAKSYGGQIANQQGRQTQNANFLTGGAEVGTNILTKLLDQMNKNKIQSPRYASQNDAMANMAGF